MEVLKKRGAAELAGARNITVTLLLLAIIIICCIRLRLCVLV